MYEGFRNIKIFFSFFYIKQKLALENLDWSHICQFLSCIFLPFAFYYFNNKKRRQLYYS